MKKREAGSALTGATRTRRRVGAAAAERRKAGGKLAAGRPSATRAELTTEREYVMRRSEGWCELLVKHLADVPTRARGTDFAHVIARSQGGEDSRFNALWLCRAHHLAMEAPFSKGRLLVTRGACDGWRGFHWQIDHAASKFAYRKGEYTTSGAGFIRAERETDAG